MVKLQPFAIGAGSIKYLQPFLQKGRKTGAFSTTAKPAFFSS
jgi:hypothetical protein